MKLRSRQRWFTQARLIPLKYIRLESHDILAFLDALSFSRNTFVLVYISTTFPFSRFFCCVAFRMKVAHGKKRKKKKLLYYYFIITIIVFSEYTMQ